MLRRQCNLSHGSKRVVCRICRLAHNSIKELATQRDQNAGMSLRYGHMATLQR